MATKKKVKAKAKKKAPAKRAAPAKKAAAPQKKRAPARLTNEIFPSVCFGGAPQNTKGRLLFRNLPPSNHRHFQGPYSIYNIPFVDRTFPANRSSSVVA